MVIKYTNYSNGVHYLELKKNADKLGLETPFYGNVVVKCKMDKSIHQIVIDCNLSAFANLECDRCTVDYKHEINSNFQLIYLFSRDDFESKDDINICFISPEQDKIDLSKDVFEYCGISIPLKKLCNEDCKGLCSNCGTDLNQEECNCKNEIINPIWEPLLKLKNSKNN